MNWAAPRHVACPCNIAATNLASVVVLSKLADGVANSFNSTALWGTMVALNEADTGLLRQQRIEKHGS